MLSAVNEGSCLYVAVPVRAGGTETGSVLGVEVAGGPAGQDALRWATSSQPSMRVALMLLMMAGAHHRLRSIHRYPES